MVLIGEFYKQTKKIHMKQLLFLLLFPSLAFAQYQGNANQKITLGEQTTADGLVYRGLAADTTRKPSVDTMAYILLDTNTNIIWQYKKATNNAWTRVGGSISSGVTGVLPVANGGTGSTTQNFVDLTTTQTVAGIKTFSNAMNVNGDLTLTASGFQPMIVRRGVKSIGAAVEVPMRLQNGTNNYVPYAALRGVIIDTTTNSEDGSFQIHTTLNGEQNGRFEVRNNGNVGIDLINDGITPSEKLHINGNARITAMNGIGDIGADANGVLQAATSDMNLKNTIENSPFGLNEILLLNPVTFLYNDENRKIDSDVKEVGFIAQDVFDIIPNAVSSTGTGDLQLDYRAITAALTKAIQEQQALIKALEQRILTLENK